MHYPKIKHAASHSGNNEANRSPKPLPEVYENEIKLVEMLDATYDTPVPSTERINSVKSKILEDLRPVRPILPPTVIAVAFFFLFVVFTALSTLFLKSYGWDVLMPFQKITIFTSLAATAALLAFSLSRQIIPGSKTFLRSGSLSFGLFALLLLIVACIFQIRSEAHFLLAGKACVVAGVPYALPAALLFAWLLRCGTALSPKRTAAAAGMLAGLVSTSALEMHCPNLDMWHILVWHFGFPLFGALAGLLLAFTGEKIRQLLA